MINIPSFQKNIIQERFEDQKKSIENEIKDWIHEQLEEYDKFYYLVNEMMVHNVENLKIEISNIEYKIIDSKGSTVFIVVDYDYTITGDVTHDDINSSQHDTEEGRIFFNDQTETSIDHEDGLTSVFKIDIRSEDDFDEEFEVDSHNNGEPLEFG